MGSSEMRSGAADPFIAIISRAIEMAIEKGIAMGVQAAMDYLEEEKAKAKRGRYERRLYNTRLLLKNYRLFKQHAEGAIYNARQVKESAFDILDGLENAMISDKAYVAGIKKSQQYTIIVLHHIEEMLRFYKISCEQSGKPEEMRRYRVIMAMYIDDKKLTAQQIAENECIETRTVYKDITNAVKPLSSLIFGIDSLRLR